MAKKRRVKPRPSSDDRPKAPSIVDNETAQETTGTPFANQPLIRRVQPIHAALALLGTILVFAAYYPSDSVAVENGDALWFCGLAIILCIVATGNWIWNHASFDAIERESPGERRKRFVSLAIDCSVWGLALWVSLAAFGTVSTGNLRLATNEAWLWLAAAAVFTSVRRIAINRSTRNAVLVLLVMCSIGQAVHGLHQHWIGLPDLIAQYKADPDKILAQVGQVAPPDSVERMVFESRLFDGGPTGTFSLANSLAAVLIVGSLLVVGTLRYRFGEMLIYQRAAAAFAIVLLLLCLWYAQSRSATAATTMSIIAIVAGAGWFGSGATAKRFGRQLFVAAAAALVALLGVGTLSAAFGPAEWFQQAPASLAFRFQYWRSTLALVFDRPLFGCGPGNFQSIYPQYREMGASEQIADPHNFFFETLAAGGFLAGALVVVLVGLVAWNGFQILNQQARSGENDSAVAGQPHALWIGAGVTLFLVWLLGYATGQLPDFKSQLITIPVAIGLGLLLMSSVSNLDSKSADFLCVVTCGAVLVHLMIAGGWTIPGVGIHLWVLAGLFTRISTNDSPGTSHSGAHQSQRFKRLVAVLMIGTLSMFLLRWISLTPVTAALRAKTSLAIAEIDATRRGSGPRRMQQAIDDWVAADDWSAEAHIRHADSVHWSLVSDIDSSSARKQWQSALNKAISCAGQSPSLYRECGRQALHLYQRWGKESDLRLADQWFSQAALWNPTDHRLAAQLAVIAESLQDENRARDLAFKAADLAAMGNNVERELGLQMILPPKVIGTQANQGAMLVAADKALKNQLDKRTVDDQNVDDD